MADAPRLKIRLSPAAELAVRRGHPWVYAESIRQQNRPGEPGELAVLYDAKDRFLAVGAFDAASPLRVRILHRQAGLAVDDAFWRERLAAAQRRRQPLADAQTNGYRLIHGENDGFPGLVADVYAGVLVIKLYSAWWLSRLEMLQSHFQAVLAPQAIILRFSRNMQKTAADRNKSPGLLWGQLAAPQVLFQENGLTFESDVLQGQKTGFFLDQRENRARIESLARGRHVLNTFSFSGGFSLYAARGGARSVTDVDISPYALESSRRNAAHNPSLAATPRHYVQADVFAWLEQRPTQRYDLILTDPPSLAKREVERTRATQAYQALARHALEHLAPQGIYAAASCSAHVSEAEFFQAVEHSAKKSGRRYRILWSSNHALDHPSTFPEADYLKCLCLAFEG
jgi:23S rRNA (cytosine1962-C5)-methyltransferase